VSLLRAELLRLRQWPKNLVCLGGAFFAGHMLDGHIAARAGLAVAAFCALRVLSISSMISSTAIATAIIPARDFVPLPRAGSLSLRAGAGCCHPRDRHGPGACLGPGVLGILASYAVLNVCYSAALKNLSLVDATVVAAGFILRIYAGTMAVGVRQRMDFALHFLPRVVPCLRQAGARRSARQSRAS